MFIICVYDTIRSNKVGHLRQLESLVRAFGIKDSYIINLSKENRNSFFSNFLNIIFQNLYLGIFKKSLQEKEYPPDIIITIGHRTAIYGFLLKHYYSKKFGSNIKHVHIFFPGIFKSFFCDTIVSPFPIKKFFAKKVVEVDGIPSFIEYKPMEKDTNTRIISVALGDEFFLRTKKDALLLVSYLKKIDKSYLINIITSRRTKQYFTINLRHELLPNMKLYEFGFGENIFTKALIESDAYIISADSISMISEVLSIAKKKAVYIYGLGRLKSRKSFKYASKAVKKGWVLELEKVSSFTTNVNRKIKFDVLAQFAKVLKNKNTR